MVLDITTPPPSAWFYDFLLHITSNIVRLVNYWDPHPLYHTIHTPNIENATINLNKEFIIFKRLSFLFCPETLQYGNRKNINGNKVIKTDCQIEAVI